MGMNYFDWVDETSLRWRCSFHGERTDYVVYQEVAGGYFYATRDTHPVRTARKRPRRAWWATLQNACKEIERRVAAEALARRKS